MLLTLLSCGVFLRAASHLLVTSFSEPISGLEGSGYRSTVLALNLDFLGRYLIWLSSAALTSTMVIQGSNWARRLLVGLSIVFAVYLAMFFVTSYGDAHEAVLHGIVLTTAMFFASVSRRTNNFRLQIQISHLVWFASVVAVAMAGYTTIVGWCHAVAVASLVGISGAGVACVRNAKVSKAGQYAPIIAGTLTLAVLLVLFGLSRRPIMLMYTYHGIFPMILATLLTVFAVPSIFDVAIAGEPADARESPS